MAVYFDILQVGIIFNICFNFVFNEDMYFSWYVLNKFSED